jgi:hypothetical protein
MPLLFYKVSASINKFGQSHVFRFGEHGSFLYPDIKFRKERRNAPWSMQPYQIQTGPAHLP